MKRKPLFLVLAGFFFLSFYGVPDLLNAAPGQKTDKEREGLFGPVKTVYVEIGKMSKDETGKWVPSSRMPWLSTTYDLKGNRIEEDQLYNEEALNFKSFFVHDSKGRLKEGLETDFKGTVVFKWRYTRETAMKITEKRVFPNGKLFSTSVYLYDDSGNLIEEVRRHSLAGNSFKWTYAYDGAGRMLEESFYLIRSKPLLNQKGLSLNYKSVYRYGKEGHPTGKIHFGPTGVVESDKRYRYEFDAEGNWISQTAWEISEEGDASELIPTEVTFRKIKYYLSKGTSD
ncbi:MAG: RHS repeat domain-containing protein [Nitrospira sp.]|nr:hypothetical protein [Candidatus Manganitrophaceae bacterium]HIL34404.1 hypothetical protein [Candidatus Manganitrophaceae bacterium]